jgi:hypothetical protein
MNSKQPARYIKARMSDDLKNKILVQNGIMTNNDIKPIPTVSECVRCKFINTVENKFCSACSYPLTSAAFDEIKKAEDIKLQALQDKYENEISSVREEMGVMQNKFQQILAKIDVTTLRQ